MRLRRGSGCVIFEVRLTKPPAPWRPGPYPVRLPRRAEAADRELRLTYFESRLQEVLYGTDGAPVRWHRQFATPVPLTGACVRGVEILRMPLVRDGLGLAVLHVDLTDPGSPGASPVPALERLSRLATASTPSGTGRDALQALLPAGTQLVESSTRARTLAHVTFEDRPAPVMSAPYTGWSPVDQWLWLLASACSEERFAPDPDEPAVRSGTVVFSADWRALVLREGAAFVGMTPDREDEGFHALAEAHVHSIYLDAVLIGVMQLYALNEVANAVASTPAGRLDADALASLEHRLMNVRRRLWFSHVTVRGKGNELLRQFQDQHALPALLDNIISELSDAARLVEAVTNRGVNAALGLLTILGLPIGIAFSSAAVWGEPHPRLFLISALAAVAGAVVVVAVVRPARQMLRALLRRGPR
ncbi:hypothetical protein [Streptomyces sp. NPDC006552]|uniref:hypothetical protein n=1 Tax=Streptomyces sp. NPDC006552 TaxID=3157179 RepID=UPI0033ACC609